jgi:hypothetical protein
MSDLEKQIYDIRNISAGLYYPGFTKYLSDNPSASARTFSTEDIFKQLKISGRFLSPNNEIKSTDKSIFKSILFENEDDAELYQKFINIVPVRRSFNYRIISNHATDNIKSNRYGFPPHVKYRVNSPNANRKAFLTNYKSFIRFTTAFNVSKLDDKTFYKIKKFIWDFYKAEKYPVEERMFQCFCLEYYFDKNNVVDQGIKMYFKSDEDAAQFSFTLGSLFGEHLDIF